MHFSHVMLDVKYVKTSVSSEGIILKILNSQAIREGVSLENKRGDLIIWNGFLSQKYEYVTSVTEFNTGFWIEIFYS